VHLALPETGVCSTDAATSCDVPEPVLVGFPTGLAHGRSGGNLAKETTPS